MKKIKNNWQECKEMVETINPHYSIVEKHQEEMFKFIKKNIKKGGLAVELGVCWGRTVVIFGYLAKRIGFKYLGLDHFGLVGVDQESIVRESLGKLDIECEVVKTNTEDYPWEEGRKIDMLFIDGGHDEENVKRDVEMWTPRIADGGLVIFHDYDEILDRENSPHWAVKYYADLHTGDWKDIYFNDGLKIRQKTT